MIRSTLCYIENDDAYLMLHRVKKNHDANHDKWIGVGGKFEVGESPEVCMLREVKEETGLTLLTWKYRGIVSFHSDLWEDEEMHLFTSNEYTGNLIDCNEGVLELVNKNLITQLPIWEGDKIFLDLIRKDHPFFYLELFYRGDSLISAILDGISIV